MMTRTHHILTLLALVLTAPVATAQYPPATDSCTNGSCGFTPNSNGYSPTSNYRPLDDYTTAVPYRSNTPTYGHDTPLSSNARDSYSGMPDDFRSRMTDERLRLTQGYDYQSPLNNAVDDTFRRPLSYNTPSYKTPSYNTPSYNTPSYNTPSYNTPSHNTQDRGRGLHEAYENRGRLPDPFRLPTSDTYDRDRSYRNVPLSRDYPANSDFQSRYRVPLDRVDYSHDYQDYGSAPLSRDRYDYPAGNTNLENRPPTTSPVNQTRPGLDPFTPPLPRRGNGNNEVESINNAISARYSNPVNVRSARAMSGTQALALYREVSQQTDQRHLEPSSYDLRIRRGIRNLGLALENPTFVQSLGIQADSFRVDGFRTTLSRIAEGMRVSNYNDAQQVVQSVMQEAQNVPGLTPNIVAFEFANATIDTLDKFSALEPAEPGRGASLDLQRAEQVRSAALESEIVGIGVEVKVHENGLLIMKTLRGGPAADAKLQSGDIITAIDGRNIQGMSMANSVDLMKGSSGSRIQLTISRNGSRGSNVTLTRRSIRIYTVNDMKILPNTEGVAYLSLSQFGQKSTEEMDQALNQLYNSGMKSLVLDLRGNPGGLLNVCVDITNRFLPCGTIVSTKGRLASDNMLETATYSRTWSTPLVVLVDGDSASASEIFAAAVQDNRRGIVVGERSYGKGTVQTHFPLSTVGGNLRLTTARFYSPNGRAMSGEGVTPDVRIADADGPANGDRQLDEAITIAQSQRLKDIAQAARQCRPSASGPLQRNSMKGQDINDMVAPRTVLR